MDRTLQSSKKTKRRTIRIDEWLAAWLESKWFNPRVRIESKIEMEKTNPSSPSLPIQTTQAPTDIKDIVDQLISFLNNSDNNEQKESLKLALWIQSINIAAYFQKNIWDKLQDYIYWSAWSSFPIASLLAELVKMWLLNESAVPEQIRIQTQDTDKQE